MAMLKFKKSKGYEIDGQYQTECNGIQYVVFRNGDIGGVQDWYFHRKGAKARKEFEDKYYSKPYPVFSCLWTRADVEKAIMADAGLTVKE